MNMRIVILILIGLLVTAVAASAGCVGQAGPSVTPKPAPTESRIPKPESFVPDADTVVIGRVVEGLPPIQEGQNIYRDWVVEVESYVVNPLPDASLKVRILEQSGKMPVKGVHLREGEQLLLFLKTQDDHFTLLGGLMGAKYVIEDDKLRFSMYAFSPWEPLDETIARVKAVAKTWAGEELTEERRAEVIGIALDDPGIKDYLTGKDYEIGSVAPYRGEIVTGEIRYLVSISIPQRHQPELELAVVVNVTLCRVDETFVNLYATELSEKERNQVLQIALADRTVQELIGDRGYKVANINKGSCQETRDGKTSFYIFPKVELWLQPTLSENLEVYVNLGQKKVVKIFTESHLSPTPLESTASDRDFTLTLRILKTDYRVGEITEAILTLSYTGDQPVELTSPGGQYFDLLIRDGQGNIVYHWERQKYGPPPPLLPTVRETIAPDQSITRHLEFTIPQAGTFYIRGRNFGGWDYGQVLAAYPDGSGYGLYIETPFVLITAC